MANLKYLVYDNPEGTEVAFVTDTNGKPRVYNDLELAQDCANDQTNGYVVPLGWDPIDCLDRLQSVGETTIKWQTSGEIPSDKEVNNIIEIGVELSREMANVMQQPFVEV